MTNTQLYNLAVDKGLSPKARMGKHALLELILGEGEEES
jgi:hypothetical protein